METKKFHIFSSLLQSGTSVILTWAAPHRPNGEITSYILYEVLPLMYTDTEEDLETDTETEREIYRGLWREFEFRRLSPYSQYTVYLTACTVAGCTQGEPRSFYTAQVCIQTPFAPYVFTMTGQKSPCTSILLVCHLMTK